LRPGAQTGSPQGLAIDCRFAILPTALYYEGYGRQGRLSDKGFHKSESFEGFNHFNRDFLFLRNHQPGTSEGISHGSGSFADRFSLNSPRRRIEETKLTLKLLLDKHDVLSNF
jgi:hypothetical protein